MPSADGEDGADLGQLGLSSSSPSMRLLRMEVISSGLICMRCCGSLMPPRGRLLSKVLEAVADGGVEDGVADLQDEAAEDVGVDARW